MKLRIHAAAEQEAQQAAQWYEDRRVGLGFEFLAAVDTALQRIGDDPLQFPILETLPDEPSVRRFLLKRFPYTIIYEVVSPEIQVLAVAHVRRRPQYWKKRH